MKALITGANKGIGYGIAKALGAKGYELIIAARDEKRGQEAVNSLEDLGYKASYLKIDLNDLSTISAAAQEVEELDLLINNAGISGNIKAADGSLNMEKAALDYTTEDLKEAIDINFIGTHAVISAFLPKLTEEGKILNVTVPVSSPYWAPFAYVTSKAAQNVMTITLGREFAKAGSKRTIFGVMPGAVATDLNGTKPGDLGGIVISTDQAGESITHFLFDGNDYNGKLVQYDGKVVTSYEHDLFG
ncbi:SDR family NAD(P)-dependent oxidoreductase [Lactococcus termiticola]|uniref:Carbonyl reductase n=1 Tax=Lactococcus termiticola TaxID=2169526 RepID=A0A2R5HIT2_9LACT|nr:SDR family NAD(P)-dependent oxidoreductase [Lactococcus termiticola]GBG95991.1 carbonyl reductase [Lactococcus termiticola]